MPTLINGESVVWSDIQIPFLGVPITGVTAISWNEKQDKTNNYGVGNKPVARGRGRITYSGSITMLAEEWKNIVAASPSGSLLKIPMFDLPILYVSSSGLYMKTILKAMEFTENMFDSKEGDSHIPITLPFIFADIQQLVV